MRSLKLVVVILCSFLMWMIVVRPNAIFAADFLLQQPIRILTISGLDSRHGLADSTRYENLRESNFAPYEIESRKSYDANRFGLISAQNSPIRPQPHLAIAILKNANSRRLEPEDCVALPSPQLSRVPADATQHLQRGLALERQRDLDGAIREFIEATKAAPDYDLAFVSLGDAYMKKGDFADAVAPLKRASALNPSSDVTKKLLGYALLAEGYASEAISQLEQVHEYRALGIAQMETGKYADAVTSLLAALAQTPDDPDVLFYLGRSSEALSTQALDRLLTQFPNSDRAHQALGQQYFSTKETDKAIQEYELALQARPNLPGLHLELGQIYARISEWPKAEGEFRREVALQPGSAEAAYRLGYSLLQQGKMKDAADELQRSAKMQPDNADTLYALGKATFNSDASVAERSLIRVTELEKDTRVAAQAFQALATLHRKQGKTELGAQEMREFQRINALVQQNQPK
jgi:tetratricopeptide (TPR) repeat protein